MRIPQVHQAKAKTQGVNSSKPKGGAGGAMAFLYEQITNRFLAALETNRLPWVRQYKAGAGTPKNYVSRRAYSSINWFLLADLPYKLPYYLTQKQINGLGGYIRKGEAGHVIIFWKLPNEAKTIELAEKGIKAAPMLRYYKVWNVEQVEGIDFSLLHAEATQTIEGNQDLKQLSCEEVVNRMVEDGVKISHNCPTNPQYLIGTDTVLIPEIQHFTSPEQYYHTLLHELIHATGAAFRLDRKFKAEHDITVKENRAFEELIAEMGSCFTQSALGLTIQETPQMLQNSAAYLQSWIQVLKNDATAIVRAASKAQQAANYLLNRQVENQPELYQEENE